MPPPPDSDARDDESAVPLKKARRERGRGSNPASARASPKEGRKRPNSMGRDDQSDATPNSRSHTNPPSRGFASSQHHPHSSASMLGPPGKMLLPRLHHKSSTPDAKPSGKERTSHACDKCRKAKAKCSGGQPCEKCKSEDKECVYGDGKRDKVKKELESLKTKNAELKTHSRNLINFLNDLHQNPVMSRDTRRDIDEVLANVRDIDLDPDVDDKRRASGDTGEDDADAQEVASMGSLDAINEDTNRDQNTRAAGFLGKSSAVRWVQRTKGYLDEDENQKGSQKDADEPDNAFMAATCHADDGDFEKIGPESVNMYDMPPLDLATTLMDAYFRHVQPAVPIISEHDFRESFDKYAVHSPNEQSQIGTKQQNFLCSMNLVFAIAARHAHVIDADYQGPENDHLIYFARASALGLDDRALHQDSELENTTSLALASLYFLTLEHINRAWTWAGIALRSALTLGLHLRSQTRSLSDVDKEYRIRIFWCCYSLERVLNQLTGRPSCISLQDISVNLPLNINESDFQRGADLYDEHRKHKSDFFGASAEAAAKAVTPVPRMLQTESSRSGEDASPMDTSPVSKYSSITSVSDSQGSQGSNSDNAIASQEMTTSTYFIHHIRLSIIAHQIFQDLYSPIRVRAKWGDVEDAIRSMDRNLRTWRDSIPWQYRFNPEDPRSTEPPEWRKSETVKDQKQRREQWKRYAAERIGLAMMWSSSRMMLYRPTLCRLSQEIRHESDRSKHFNADAASACVQAARNMIACLPPFDSDQPNKRNRSYLSDDQFGSDVLGIHSFVPWWNTPHYIIEASSVLIMELAYRADHVPSQAEFLCEDTKTAVRWMRHLACQSVMARKGSGVYEVLLRRVAPRVGCDAGSMVKDSRDPASSRSHVDDNDTSSDTIKWSGHNESAARLEQRASHSPNQPLGMQPPQNYGHLRPYQQNPSSHLLNQQTTAPSPNTIYGQPMTTMSGAQPNDFSVADMGGLALEDFHFAGGIYGAYDQFGPWFSNSFDNFGVYDPVMDARLGGGVNHSNYFGSSQAQNNSSMGGTSQMVGGSAQMSQPPMMNQTMGQHQQMGRQRYSPMTNSSVTPATAGDMSMGRLFAYDSIQQNPQQLPPLQQMSNMQQQGGGYPPSSSPYVWDGTLPPVNEQLPQHQTQQQQQQQQPSHHQNLPSLYGQGMNLPHHQGMIAPQNQSTGGPHGPNQHSYHSHPPEGMNNQPQNQR